MTKVRLTKHELRNQQKKLTQLKRYLPTLQLKKSMLQSQVTEARSEILRLEDAFHEIRLIVSHSSSLLSERIGVDLTDVARVKEIKKRYENIAGVDIPLFEGIDFEPFEYPLYTTPAWLDSAVSDLRKLAFARAKVIVAQEKKRALEKELRDVTIRVNLFEKNLIPKSERNIKRIKIFLGDQELAAVAQAKVAKTIKEKKLED